MSQSSLERNRHVNTFYHVEQEAARPFLLRGSMAFIWVETAVVSALASPGLGLELLGRMGLRGTLARAVMYGTCGFELLLGLLVASGRFARPLAVVQALLIGGFTVIISIVPDLRPLWLHPFGPIAKNLPLLGGVAVLWAFSDASDADSVEFLRLLSQS